MEPLGDIIDDSPIYDDPSVFSIRRSYPEPPPGYSEEEYNEKRAVEVCTAQPNAIFEPEERQRHFGILRYTVNNRFNKIMVIGGILVVLIIILIIGVTLLIVFTVSRGNPSTVPSTTSTTKEVPLPSSIKTTERYLTTKTNPTNNPLSQECTPLTKTTFLFSYSNDFDSDTVMNAFNDFYEDTQDHFSMYATIRFDTVNEADFQYSNNFTTMSIQNYLPDPFLGYSSSSTGSDVLRMLNRFLDNDQVPVCGSQILAIVRRYPNEIEISGLVSKLRYYHASVTFVVSTNSSGGYHPETLYNIASRTNGFCSFNIDINQDFGTVPVFDSPLLVYAANPTVYGKGIIHLPPMTLLESDSFYCALTVQDDGPMDVVRTALLRWSSSQGEGTLGLLDGFSYDVFYGNHDSQWESLDQLPYNMTLEYEYTDYLSRTLQIRIHQWNSTVLDYWPPFDN